MIANQTADDVDRRTGGERHDDLDRFIRIGLRVSDRSSEHGRANNRQR
jgi:hypothetical protein